DWEGLQLGGMICAGLMCIAGLLFALSGKCKCKNKQKHGSLPEKAVPLLIPGEMDFFESLPGTQAVQPYNLRINTCYAVCKAGLS
ncbi:hypothetical protein G4228_010668, partial [Cervus hanglu yarkandensis]